MAPIVAKGGPEAKQAVELFVREYGSAKVWVEDQTGRYERAVRSAEVGKAQAWLGSYRDTGDSGREDAGGGAVSAGRAGLEWVSIPGGSFSMGSNDGASDEKPVHTVRVSGFEMARSEVTFGQYQACVDAGACTVPHVLDGACRVMLQGKWQDGNLPSSFRGEDSPVVCVDWHQAKAYSEWVGGRLPTESEWEYAARGGQSYTYAGSNTVGDVAWLSENSGGATHAVCGKKRNGYGLCDMSGNVWEWVEDWYHGSYSGAPADGSAWLSPAGSSRVLRGGSWYGDARCARVAYRSGNVPGYRSSSFGFRPVR